MPQLCPRDRQGAGSLVGSPSRTPPKEQGRCSPKRAAMSLGFLISKTAVLRNTCLTGVLGCDSSK